MLRMNFSIFQMVFSLSTILLLIQACGNLVKIEQQEEEHTTFITKSIPFISQAKKEKVKIHFSYEKKSLRDALVLCVIKLRSKESDLGIQGIKLTAKDVHHYASTYDALPVISKGKDHYLHNITIFVPVKDFQKLLESNSIAIELNEMKYSAVGKRWQRISDEIKLKKLMPNSTL